MIALFGLIIFIVSLIGYNGILRMIGVNQYLSWLTTMIVQTLLIYVFSMIGYMKVGIYTVAVIGWIFFIYRIILLIRRKGQLPFEGIHYFDVWMTAIGLIMVNLLYRSPLIHYDNYSHWAVIVKFLTFEGHLPGKTDALISFTSYPPATALFMTNLTTWLGFSEGIMLVGQFLLIWAGMYAIFGVLRDRTRALNGFIICFVIAIINIFNIAIRMNNLLVDFILPIVAAAGIAGVYIYRNQPKLQMLHMFLIGSELLLIKNSGSFFVVIIAIYLLYQVIRNAKGGWLRRTGKGIGLTIVAAGLSYLPFYWWEWHVKHVFVSVSKHQISAAAYKSQLAHESTTVIYKIGHKFLSQILSFDSLSTRGILLINICLLVTWLAIRYLFRKKNNLFKVLVALDVIFIAYYISVFAMYIVSMPYAEAILLDGFERYISSMVMFNMLLATMAIVVAMDHTLYEQRIEKRDLRAYSSIFTKNAYQISSLVFMIFSVIMMFSEINGIEYNNSIGQLDLPVQLKKIAKQSTTYTHTKVLVVDPHQNDVDNYYAGYVGRYYFFSDKVVGQENFMMSKDEFKKTLDSYSYVVIPEWHRTFTVMVEKIYHQHLKTGLYRVTADKLVRIDRIN